MFERPQYTAHSSLLFTNFQASSVFSIPISGCIATLQMYPSPTITTNIGQNVTLSVISDLNSSESAILCRHTSQLGCPAHATYKTIFNSAMENNNDLLDPKIQWRKRSPTDLDIVIIDAQPGHQGCYTCMEIDGEQDEKSVNMTVSSEW